MKAIFSQDQSMADDESVLVSDIRIADIVLEDSEAKEIIVDDFLSSYSYQEAGQVLNKILTKLRLGGVIHVSFIDANLICHKFALELIDLEEFNSIFFKPRKSLLNMFVIKDLLQQNNIKIDSIKNLDSGKIIITGVRNV